LKNYRKLIHSLACAVLLNSQRRSEETHSLAIAYNTNQIARTHLGLPMLQIDLKHLPTSDELPDSDDTPVDNEDQNFSTSK